MTLICQRGTPVPAVVISLNKNAETRFSTLSKQVISNESSNNYKSDLDSLVDSDREGRGSKDECPKVLHPVHNWFGKALDYQTYRLAHDPWEYNDLVSKSVAKLASWQFQMHLKPNGFDVSDPVLKISFQSTFQFAFAWYTK